ncbi:HAMP domain-containing histidine kinase [Sphingomonas sp. NBWT7]|uniref:sensor histidine kinase n=1 Tax=Sphingomonas sp. NBWT7 TaxID=2596913 RepID=UPI001623E0A3|nr:HAMP domain-containing sensor histidine kinase [Sphingomonas sp. NBWT7]QNE31078.1 HAMP domain-containing histidine kinase [Sphingomonas sp. NBWT7]
MQHRMAFMRASEPIGGAVHVATTQTDSAAAIPVAAEPADLAVTRALRSAMAAAGHDLMQPLQIISHALERLDLAEQLAADRVWIEAARTQVRRMARGLADLVGAAISQEPFGPPVLQCLGAIMDETEAVWAKSAAAGGVRLEIARLSVPVRTDRVRMRSILDNLIGNALKYGRGFVRVSTWRSAGKVRVDVLSDGTAIPADTQARLFEAFYQADASSDGLGLGLSIVREHCLALGHFVEVASGENGTRFSIVFEGSADS